MIIKRLINNNIVVVDDADAPGSELLIMGSGIGFKMRAGDTLDEARVEKRYRLVDAKMTAGLAELIESLPAEHVALADTLMRYIEKAYGKGVNSALYISVLDHVSAALQRHEKGLDIKNPMLWDIQRFYPSEFELGCDLLDVVEKKLGVRLAEDEAGFLALHIVSAQLDAPDVGLVSQITDIVHSILNIVKYQLRIDMDEGSVEAFRFVTHLKFFAQRLLAHGGAESAANPSSADFLDFVKTRYERAYRATFTIENYLNATYGYTMDDDERVYLTIHIARILEARGEGDEDAR